MAVPEEDDYRWLVSGAANRYLDIARAPGESLVAITKSLRRELTTARAHLVLELVELRRRAREKFSRADEMFFTRQLLEQATDERIAEYKAGRVSSPVRLLDLCCGAGGDLVGWAGRAECLGIDRDPIAVLMARANLAVYGLQAGGASVGDAAAAEVSEAGAWHLDPDRRASGRRTTQLAYSAPGVDTIERLLQRQPTAALKLAPATQIPERWRGGSECEWIGSRRECRQQVVWFGNWARCPGLHRATVVDRGGQEHGLTGSAATKTPCQEQLGRYLIEPHAVVRAAGLVGVYCAQHRAAAWLSSTGYLTSDGCPAGPLSSGFEVCDVLAFDLRRLRAVLKQRRVGRVEIKVRGLDADPADLAHRLKLVGDQEQVLLVTGPRAAARVVLARRAATRGACQG